METLPVQEIESPALALTKAFYRLNESEFFHSERDFPEERESLRVRIESVLRLPPSKFFPFVRELIQEISNFCNDPHLHPDVLYRAFDALDEILEIDYRKDLAMQPAAPSARERLYEGGGRGVQTSYSTIFKVLESLQLPQKAHLVDLGSGFGRVGLATGLWRDDLRFSGYEYVAHRVAVSQASAERAGLADRIHFFQQDLSDPAFIIPEADVYYLYDPFSSSTYQQVFARISELGRRRSTMVVAKADARQSFRSCTNEQEWHRPDVLDEGTLLAFRSRGKSVKK